MNLFFFYLQIKNQLLNLYLPCKLKILFFKKERIIIMMKLYLIKHSGIEFIDFANVFILNKKDYFFEKY